MYQANAATCLFQAPVGPSSPSQGGDQEPLFHPAGWVPPHLSAQFPCCRPLPANVKGSGIEKQNPSRKARRLPPL